MKLVTAHVGSSALVRLTGRLDGEWSRHLADTLDELLRDGLRSVVLDLSQVDYISSPGVHVLGQRYRDYSALRGELRIAAPSRPVLQALAAAGLLDHLLLAPGDGVAGTTGRPSAAVAQPGEFTGEAWQVPTLVAQAGAYETSRRQVTAAALACHLVGRSDGYVRGYQAGDCRRVQFPASAFGLGLGAIGDEFDECRPRFGELAAAAGTVAYLPTDGALVPDYVTGRPDAPPAAVLGVGLVCEGSFSNLIRFQPQPGSAAVPLTELAEMALATSGAEVAGLVIAAEVSDLMTAMVRRSPAALETPLDLEAEAMREWLAFLPERAAGPRTAVLVGVIAREAPAPLAALLRPVGGRGLTGHLHAMVFGYRPIPQRTVALRALVDKLFETQPLRSVGHVVFDDRAGEGAGDNTLLRGLCWVGPITSLVPLT
jgi:anti-anti-sigma factor